MRFGRFEGADRGRFWAVVDADEQTVRPIDEDFPSWAARFSAEGDGALDLSADPIDLSSLVRLAPYEPGARIFGCGANYWEHLKQTGLFEEPPTVPVAYFKADSSIIGPDSEIRHASYTDQLDYEVELVAVVGRPLESGAPASASLLGYSVGNDVSIRDTDDPFGTPDLFTMKGADRMSPVGPYVYSNDEVGGVGQPSLDISLRVNGEVRQHDNTKNVIFSIDFLLEWINLRNTLRPGDLLYTGTPAGSATEHGQQRFLRPGDAVEAEIERLGVLRNTVGEKET